jgi:ketosteroid isomerase-like protein
MAVDDRGTVEQALATFVDAFTSLDRARMEACFTDDATVFHRFGASRRHGFWDEEFETWRATRPGPPYLSIDPKDLQIQELGNEVAIVSFHLDNRPGELGRRTLVFAKTPDGWKIAHLHASVMPLSG